jgi:hypothetical protein
MSNPWQSQVNQKLYFAQLLLTDARDKSGSPEQALLQATVFHLATAYRLYLKEIAQHQRHTTDAQDARSARRQLATQGWVCQELEELARLEEDGQWPARLLLTYREIIGDVDTPTITVKTGQSAPPTLKEASNSIAITDITEAASTESYRQWLEQFQTVISAQRESAQEW